MIVAWRIKYDIFLTWAEMFRLGVYNYKVGIHLRQNSVYQGLKAELMHFKARSV